MTQESNLYALSQISNVHVKYLAFSIEKNIKISDSPCSSGGYIQNVTMMLICKGNAGIYNWFTWSHSILIIVIDKVKKDFKKKKTKIIPWDGLLNLL